MLTAVTTRRSGAMPDDPATPDQIREAHPDWTDEQVTAEVTRLAKPAEPPAEKPAEKP